MTRGKLNFAPMRTVGRIAAMVHALAALVMSANLLLLNPEHFSSPVWDGPKAFLFNVDSGSVRPFGWAFFALGITLAITAHLRTRPFYKFALFGLATMYGVLCAAFFPAGLQPESSFLTSILCGLATLSVFNTLLALDPRSGAA